VTDTYVIFDREFLHARDDVEMSDADVVVDRTLAGVNDADTDADAFADLVAEEETVERAFEKRRQDRDCG
jgi:hypothetical protein